MSGPCTDCGGPDYQTLMARIAALEAMLLNQQALAQANVDLKQRAEQADARCKELAEETADRIGALNKAEAALVEVTAERDAAREVIDAAIQKMAEVTRRAEEGGGK